jgi:hypothetical protein
MMRDIVLLAISSPSDEVNYCSQLIVMKNRSTGELIFHVLLPGFQCNVCINLTLGDACPHTYQTLPEHRSLKNLEIAISLMGADKLTADQELFGKVRSSTAYMFRGYMEAFNKQPPYHFKEKVQICHTFIDPCGGSTKSDFAMSTHARENGQFVFIGCSRVVNSAFTHTDITEIDRMFQQHFRNIWNVYDYTDTHMYIYIELSSDGFQTQNWANKILALFPDQQHRMTIYYSPLNKPGQPGVMTTEADKAAWTEGAQFLFDDGSIHLAEHFITNEPETIRDTIIDQFSRYTRNVEESQDIIHGKSKITYSGKATGKDDIVTAQLAGIRHHKERLVDMAYLKWCQERGIKRK